MSARNSPLGARKRCGCRRYREADTFSAAPSRTARAAPISHWSYGTGACRRGARNDTTIFRGAVGLILYRDEAETPSSPLTEHPNMETHASRTYIPVLSLGRFARPHRIPSFPQVTTRPRTQSTRNAHTQPPWSRPVQREVRSQCPAAALVPRLMAR